MITYPSTHGIFEAEIKEIVDTIHKFGGKVFMDGANMNGQIGLTNPGFIGADICHLNLHKSFAMPHRRWSRCRPYLLYSCAGSLYAGEPNGSGRWCGKCRSAW